MGAKNAFYAQSGGVGAVINASACAVLPTARQHAAEIGKVYGGRDGIIGALSEDLIDTGLESEATIAALKHSPGGACVGIPNTIDNDLPITDCHRVRLRGEIRRDLYPRGGVRREGNEPDLAKVFVLEIMGRHAGWATAACDRAAEREGEVPHILLLPDSIRSAFSSQR